MGLDNLTQRGGQCSASDRDLIATLISVSRWAIISSTHSAECIDDEEKMKSLKLAHWSLVSRSQTVRQIERWKREISDSIWICCRSVKSFLVIGTQRAYTVVYTVYSATIERPVCNELLIRIEVILYSVYYKRWLNTVHLVASAQCSLEWSISPHVHVCVRHFGFVMHYLQIQQINSFDEIY